MAWIRTVCVLLVLTTIAAAQSDPHFEVASIHPAAEQLSQTAVGVHIDDSRVRITGLTLKLYVGLAYGLKPQQIVGPDWLGQPRFDIAAKIPDGASRDQMPLMMRALLADRFGLKSHRETREFPVYALTVAKEGLKIAPSAVADAPAERPPAVDVTSGGSAAGSGADLGRGSSFFLANNRLEIRKMTMAAIAELLTRLSDRPVIDATGVNGFYDMTLELPPEDFVAVQIRGGVNNGAVISPQALRLLDGAALDPFTNALQKFGLGLQSRKAPLDVLVIDSIQRTPTEN